MKTFRACRKYGAQVVAGGSALVASVSSFAVDPASASEALTTISAANTGYGPVMFGLAAAAVGVLIGVKWIKRGRAAA